ncbi:class I adenylate-forming enzyme family protein [Vallicoccus soli]|uniref:Long-chain-fatty-acid--CoA ligase n=1 Tax=Vallicoccus soli TaxID=2339232 RepID=A0A3A3ZN27_9ACTN|nr:AMP-binding protein [Vallicoccus soli]RJK98191.1 acyl--CoA ligase [Vallicoccus soli]
MTTTATPTSTATAAPSSEQATPGTASAERSVVRIVTASARLGDRPAVLGPAGTTTGARYAHRVLAAAATLRRLGAGPGTTVALLLTGNGVDQLVARHAAQLLGACAVHVRSMNPRTDDEELDGAAQARLLRLTGAHLLVVDPPQAARGRLLARSTGVRLLATGPGTGLAPLEGPDRLDPADAPAPAPDDRALVTSTSGSGGRPKAVVQSWGTYERLVRLLGEDARDYRPRVLAATPVGHTVAPMLDAALARGGSVVLHAGFDAGAVLDAVAADAVTDAYLAVPHLYALLDHPRLGATDLSRLRRVVYSGTPAAPHRVAEAARRVGPALVQVYGTTETGGISCLHALDHAEPELHGTVGRPFPWVDLRLVGEDGRDAAPGEVGEVWVRSPTTMDGYLGEAGTGRAPDGAVRTGDLARRTPTGHLELVGRRGRVLKVGGLKVHPAAVEQALLAHPDVVLAAAWGVSDAQRVEHLLAAVQVRPAATATGTALADHVAGLLGGPYRPERVEVAARLPLTPSGKPDVARLAAGSAPAATPDRSTPCP